MLMLMTILLLILVYNCYVTITKTLGRNTKKGKKNFGVFFLSFQNYETLCKSPQVAKKKIFFLPC